MSTTTSLTPPLGTPVSRLLLIAFSLVHVLLALGPSPTLPAVTVTALFLIIGAAAVAVLAPGRRLGGRPTVAVLGLAVAGIALVVPWLPTGGWPGYAA